MRRRPPFREHQDSTELRPQTFVDWLVWLALWLIVKVAGLVALLLVLVRAAVGFTLEALFGIRLRHSEGSDAADLGGWSIEAAQAEWSFHQGQP